jgi:ADP-ribose pyrophosphatase YjhB (NUDIX family)
MDQSSEAPVRGFRVAVNAVIERDGRVLLTRRRDNGWWNLSGGGVEPGESVSEGLQREMLEEIGVEVEIVRLAGVYSKPQKSEVVLVFLCHLAADQEDALRTSEEVSELSWFLPLALPSDLLPKHRQRVEDALSGQIEAILRDQRSSTAEDQQLPMDISSPS